LSNKKNNTQVLVFWSNFKWFFWYTLWWTSYNHLIFSFGPKNPSYPGSIPNAQIQNDENNFNMWRHLVMTFIASCFLNIQDWFLLFERTLIVTNPDWKESAKVDFNNCTYQMVTGDNFINVLQAAFEWADPKSVKKTDNLTVYFALSGSARAKAACRTLMKLTPGFPRYMPQIETHKGSHARKLLVLRSWNMCPNKIHNFDKRVHITRDTRYEFISRNLFLHEFFF